MDIPGRTNRDCRLRYTHNLDPSIIKGNFSKEEDEIIIDRHEELGNKWASIALFIPGRTDEQIKVRFRSLKKKWNLN